jgi:multisubunit Na+/H+ antiporter MnhB subunit
MKLRIAVGAGMLALLLYNLIADSKFRVEFFTFAPYAGTIQILVVISAFILPDKFAWPFLSFIGIFLGCALIFHGEQSAGGGTDTIPIAVLSVVCLLLGYLTYKNSRKPKTPTEIVSE